MAETSDQINQLKIDRTAVAEDSSGFPWRLAVGVVVVAAVAAFFLLRPGGGAIAVDTDVARKPPSAAVTSSVLDASGYVVARRQATVSSKVTGKVVEVLVEEGMRVEAGQVVAYLDDSSQRAQYDLSVAQIEAARASLAEIDAQLRAAKLERDRLRDLAERQLTSASSLDAAEANYDSLLARREAGEENVRVSERSAGVAADQLSNMTIRAPFGGIVVSKNAQPGEMISPVSAGGGFTRTGICTIVDMDSLEVEVDVNEAYIQRVSTDQRVSATLDAYPGWRIPAEVIAIIPTADRQKATVRVRIGFVERDERILRDMGVKVAFLEAEAPSDVNEEVVGVVIPGKALQQDSSGDFVWVVANSAVEKRFITLGGPADRAVVLVAAGLSLGDTVVTNSEEPLSPGQTIRIN